VGSLKKIEAASLRLSGREHLPLPDRRHDHPPSQKRATFEELLDDAVRHDAGSPSHPDTPPPEDLL
jgi:hypothetical protein